MTHDPRLCRLDDVRLRVANDHGIDATLFATADVAIESAAVTELLELLALRRTAERFAEASPSSFDRPPEVARVAVTPDFHKAAGVPVGTVLATRGFVVPAAVGNDVNCGMRVHVTDLRADRLAGKMDALETAARRIYFEGGRNIPMTRPQRHALFTAGLPGLLDAVPRDQTEGLWSLFHEGDVSRDLSRVESGGGFHAGGTPGLDDFMGDPDRASRDSQIGSIGGGNHFVEFQRVERVLDGPTAHAWGLKPGAVTVMVHTGSVSIGHQSGGTFRDVLKAVYPEEMKHPDNGVFVMPLGERHRREAGRFFDALHNAANFAFANRMFLALMALASLREAAGEANFSLLYDAPHNLVWRESHGGEDVYVHRKGACPARGPLARAGTPFEYFGEPVLVPGSMGSSSFVLAGLGSGESLCSASHGAGRALSRGEAGRGHDEEFRRFLREFRVVTPLDFRRPDVRMRKDVLEKKLADLKQEGPHAYKGIGPVVDTLTRAGIAKPVAELVPLMTIKG